MSFTPASKALARFKVLDLTRVRPGPTAARQFADWGADVTKIELPRGPDESDMCAPQPFNTTTSMCRLTLNVLLSFAQFEREVIGSASVTSSRHPARGASRC